MIFTSPRIYWATGMDYPALAWLAGSINSRRGWWRSMLLQGAVTIVFVCTFGFRGEGIDKIVVATAPYFWLFLSLTVTSLMINRRRFRGVFSGYRVPLYPAAATDFCGGLFADDVARVAVCVGPESLAVHIADRSLGSRRAWLEFLPAGRGPESAATRQ